MISSFFRSIWLFLARFWSWAYLRSGAYKVWSGVYRFFWERRFRDVPLRVYSDLADLGKILNKDSGKWRADSWKSFGDAVSRPGKAQEVFDGKFEATENFDCDDFAIYITNALTKSLAAGSTLPLAEPKFFTVMWMTGWKPGGHNVCLIKDPAGGYQYMDYGMPTGWGETVAEVARNVANRYATRESDLIGWAISEYDLTPVEYHWG